MLLSTTFSMIVVGAFVIVAVKAAKTLDRKAEILMLKVPLVSKVPSRQPQLPGGDFSPLLSS